MASEAARPSSPSPAILERASHTLLRLGAIGPDVAPAWSVGPRMDRRGSSVFRISTMGSRGIEIRAFYKEMFARDEATSSERTRVRLKQTRAGLARSMGIEERLARLLGDGDVLFSRALAVDADALVSVTLEVPGVAFGSIWRHLLSRGRLSQARDWLMRTGWAAQMIEQCTDVVTEEDRDWTPFSSRRLDRLVGAIGEERATGVSNLLGLLGAELMRMPTPVVYAHADLSSTNLLVGSSVGLIDFGWVPRIRGYDVANLAFRLDYGSALPSRFTNALIEALLEGYGEPNLMQSPAWKYHRVRLLTKVVADRRPRQGLRFRRALTEIESLMA